MAVGDDVHGEDMVGVAGGVGDHEHGKGQSKSLVVQQQFTGKE